MAEQTTNIVTEVIERLEVRRNTSNQIISYTLPEDSEKKHGYVRLVGQRNVFDMSDFNKVISNTPTVLVYPTPPIFSSIITIPSLIWPPLLEADVTISKYKWTGELVRVGSTPDSEFYYIEDGIYHTMSGNGIMNLIAEKLGVPMWFRTDNEHHDSTSTVDLGQNQFHVYNKYTYNRNTTAYVDSFLPGPEITPINVITDGISTRQIRINNYLSTATTLNSSVLSDVNHSKITGISSTQASWWLDRWVIERDIITSIGDSITVSFQTKPGSWWYKLTLNYKGGAEVTIRVAAADPNHIHDVADGGQYTTHTYEIPGEYITDTLNKITILEDVIDYTGVVFSGQPSGNI